MADGATSDRRGRRRAQTREQLLTGARAVFARKGIDNTRINEITEEADVGFGSFYTYFRSKEELVDVVLGQIIDSEGETIARLTADLEDPAEVVSVAHRHLVALATTNPVLARLFIRFDASHEAAMRAMARFARRDLERGMESGRFDVADGELALHSTGGALIATMRAVLDGNLSDDPGSAHAEGVLRLLGLDRADARAVARLPLPHLAGDDLAGVG